MKEKVPDKQFYEGRRGLRKTDNITRKECGVWTVEIRKR